MASQQDIKRRIESVRGTRKITRAMELVASARLKRAQDRIEALRPYARGMRRLTGQAALRSGTVSGLPLLEERESVERAIIVAITGDRGLAGAFNVNILRRGFQEADALAADGIDVVYTAVGKKGAGTLRFRGMTIDRTFQGFSTDPNLSDAETVAKHAVDAFIGGQADRVLIVYNAFKSVLEQTVTVEQLLPIPREFVEASEEEAMEHESAGGVAYFEPDPAEFLESLLPTYVDITILRALLESSAAELAARRTAMRNATDNAGELIDQLTLQMNRARQAAITQEILEVVAGADALT
ncbi:MAG: F0F1 ATP synthase subunit gamma [Thermoleophilia bacterium]|nr:F0F1 ATP synthase subunit gamma [Thermoleophilia bacterium]MDH3724293.1 F0F1 ATP synthase subunit gamma [Thermoleophilia bacterium]